MDRLEHTVRLSPQRAMELAVTDALFDQAKATAGHSDGLTAAELAAGIERSAPSLLLWHEGQTTEWHVEEALRALEVAGQVRRDDYSRHATKPTRWRVTTLALDFLERYYAARPRIPRIVDTNAR